MLLPIYWRGSIWTRLYKEFWRTDLTIKIQAKNLDKLSDNESDFHINWEIKQFDDRKGENLKIKKFIK